MLPRATHLSGVELAGPGSVRLRAMSLTSCVGSRDTMAWDGGCSLFLSVAQVILCLPALSWLLVRFFFLLAISPHHINHLSLVTQVFLLTPIFGAGWGLMVWDRLQC